MDFRRRLGCVDHQVSARVARCECQKLLTDPLVECERLRLQAVRRSFEPLESDRRIDVEHHGEVRQQPIGGPLGEPFDLSQLQRPTGALVGQRGVDVPVSDDNLTPARAPGRTTVATCSARSAA